MVAEVNNIKEKKTARVWDPRTQEQTAREWDHPRTQEQTAREWDHPKNPRTNSQGMGPKGPMKVW